MHPVTNASPLIFMSKGGYLDLLRVAGDKILVPEPIVQKIRQRGPADVTVRSITETLWLEIIAPSPVPRAIQAWDLGPGESAVLATAQARPGTEALLDDRAARRCADALGIPVRGTLGLVLLSKQRRKIPAARPVLERLLQTGMYLSAAVLEQALAPVG